MTKIGRSLLSSNSNRKYRKTDVFLHDVVCSSCGKHGAIGIRADGRFVDKTWGYWGWIHVNPLSTDPYFYAYSGKVTKGKRVRNPEFKKGTSRLFVEYCECAKCMNKYKKRN